MMSGQTTAIMGKVKRMLDLKESLRGAASVAILGHIRPDGDCIGSCLAVYHYIRTYFPEIRVKVYLEDFLPEFLMLKGADRICHDPAENVSYDLCISLDSADRERHGEFIRYFDSAKRTIGIDHHISNEGFAQQHLIVSDAGATAELVCELIGKEQLTKEIAECLYLGIAHDTGVFQYSNASPKTFRAVADLLETGIHASRIIDETFYQKTHVQNQILGKTLMESVLKLDGKVIIGKVSLEDREAYGVTPKELDGIVSQLRYTKGTEVAVFVYELTPDCYKISLRSNGTVNVSTVAAAFGGGGHVKAAGCEITGEYGAVTGALLEKIKAQL